LVHKTGGRISLTSHASGAVVTPAGPAQHTHVNRRRGSSSNPITLATARTASVKTIARCILQPSPLRRFLSLPQTRLRPQPLRWLHNLPQYWPRRRRLRNVRRNPSRSPRPRCCSKNRGGRVRRDKVEWLDVPSWHARPCFFFHACHFMIGKIPVVYGLPSLHLIGYSHAPKDLPRHASGTAVLPARPARDANVNLRSGCYSNPITVATARLALVKKAARCRLDVRGLEQPSLEKVIL